MPKFTKGNLAASKITREVALELGKKALSVINDEDCYYLSTVAKRCGTYRKKFSYIVEKFADDEEIQDLFEEVRNSCEEIITRHAGRGKVNVAMGIFLLKSCFNLVEVSKTEHEMKISELGDLYKKALASNRGSATDEVTKLNAV